MIWVHLGGNSQVENMISGVTRGHQNTLSLGCLVDGAVVRLVFGEVFGLAWFEPDERALGVEYFEITLDKRILVITPLTPFKEHACHNYAIFWFSWVLINNHLEVVVQQINSNVVLSSIILQSTSNESLSKEESRNPQNVW